MNEQEAIKQFKERLAIPDYKKQIPEYYEAMELAVESMELQIPKKPIVIDEREEDCVVEVEWRCPVCGVAYIELAPCHDWCPYCGNKLDWGNES